MGGILHFYSNFIRKLCKHTVDNLIRHRVLRRLTWVFTVCLCPTKNLCLYELWEERGCRYFEGATPLTVFGQPFWKYRWRVTKVMTWPIFTDIYIITWGTCEPNTRFGYNLNTILLFWKCQYLFYFFFTIYFPKLAIIGAGLAHNVGANQHETQH